MKTTENVFRTLLTLGLSGFTAYTYAVGLIDDGMLFVLVIAFATAHRYWHVYSWYQRLLTYALCLTYGLSSVAVNAIGAKLPVENAASALSILFSLLMAFSLFGSIGHFARGLEYPYGGHSSAWIPVAIVVMFGALAFTGNINWTPAAFFSVSALCLYAVWPNLDKLLAGKQV